MAEARFQCCTLRTGDGVGLAQPVLCMPHANRQLGWLLAADGTTLDIAGEDTPGIAIPVRLEQDFSAGHTRLQHALRRRFMLACHADPQNALPTLLFRHAAQDPRQDFRLEPLAPSQLAAAAAGIAAELAGALTTPQRFADVLAALREGGLRMALAEAALRCLPPDELDNLARHLLESPHDVVLLQHAMPGNPWLQRRLPALMAWRAARTQEAPPAGVAQREPSADLAGAQGGTLPSVTLGLVLNGFARAATPPRRMACVLATARDEGAYLLEWIAYHRAIGFEHIFLYTNDNTDGSDEMLRLLADAGILTWFHNQLSPTTLAQHRAYAHALSAMPAILDYRWTMIADIDEFAGLNRNFFNSMPDYLLWQEQQRAEAIALPWKTYIARPDDVWRDEPCIARFVMRAPALGPLVKMIFRTNRVWSANPHHPEPVYASNLQYRSESGESHVQRITPAQTAKPSARYAWMSHYAFRSAPEMIMKLARGRADHPADRQGMAKENRIKTFVAQIDDRHKVEDRSTELCGMRLAEERARLLTIPGLARCDADIKRAYASRMRLACSAFLEEWADKPDGHGKTVYTIVQAALTAQSAAEPEIQQLRPLSARK